jgi:hypothetical protein
LKSRYAAHSLQLAEAIERLWNTICDRAKEL